MATSTSAPAGATAGKTIAQAAKLSVLTLAIMNVTAVVSLRGLPSEATYGLTSVFYYIFAAVFFLIPVSIVAAELATGWPEKGGVFRWVGEAFGPRWGFLAIFLVWVESTIWFPTVLTFGAVAIAFARPDQKWDEALAANKLYTIAIVLIVYWAATWVTLHGLKSASRIAKWGGMIGTIIPAAILIVLGFTYFLSGHHIEVPLAWHDLVPDFTNFNNLVLAAGIFLFYAGMEMNAIHVKEIDNPSRNYPLAILISSIITVAIFVLGTLAIAFIIPASQINLVQSLLITYDSFFKVFGIDWLSPIMAIALAFGVLGGVTVWVAGPSTALSVVGRAGYLPPFFQRVNEHGAPSHILIVQGLIVTFLSIMFVVLPSVQAAYQILSQLTVTLYLIMYLLMFAAAIHLRYSEPNTPRPYKVPFGSGGMWLFAGIGLIGSFIAFVLSFVPPSQISVGSPRTYIWILIAGNVIFVAIPLIIYAVRKPHWKTAEGSADFEPFGWEKEGRMPGTPQTAPAQAGHRPN
ncbi:putative glutamine/gamma-aminobutyrate antiporter GadC [Pseudaminobacter soli (ex Li et al. 2025)]|uniref:Amino acid transporter n=1 Tax=Pseudaminobacter soli (ex Li et al. 2025) TaxID=1295366 RepID=A0A2P7SKR5_9HYPH|nr:putative glutamine/gamma-aminobutyrate antiporter GadC [Mesorhizobium soli]PSJ62921.1 amino acid transporter [Mesorhizobium soli]